MKSIFFLVCFLLVSCQSTMPTQSERLTFERIKMLKVGVYSMDQVRAVLGPPTSENTDNFFFTTRYKDPTTGANRLTLRFSKKNKQLEDLVWIPKSLEKEVSLAAAKEGFNGANFKIIHDIPHNSHALNEGGISYVDVRSGVTIRYDKNLKEVEAIAIYSTENRTPAHEKDSGLTTPYSL